MKGRLLIILTVVVMVVVLVALNAASYVRVEQEGDTERAPDRSTVNAGGTGTLALFEYLRQRGLDVVRWNEPVTSLASGGEGGVATFVIVGRTRRPVESEEAEAILRWVEAGGRLVVVDRSPNPSLLPTSRGWRVGSEVFEMPAPDVRPDDVEQMTHDVPLITPAQPTVLTRGVAEVARSRFAGRLHVYQVGAAVPVIIRGPGAPPRRAVVPRQTPTPVETPTPDDDEEESEEEEPPPPPAPMPTPTSTSRPSTSDSRTPDVSSATKELATNEADAPVIHVADGREGVGALLVDYAYGRGRVVVLSDPYVVSNAGINRADNLFLASNVVTGGRGGRIAFDEFHQGYGATENHLLAYFRGTPILWMFAQAALVALAVVWTRGRRFARALPAPRADRRSKLEFVASMAELQQRARAYDLAVENIYTRTRRALARYGGVAASAPLEQIAAGVGRRSGRSRRELEALMRECEDAIAGAPLAPRRAVALARALRELERDLGILMRSREIRQAR
ncbi:MAG TPA: DUF4350 domain-containing protein [Pyrinomonadaceae bacterium]|nr:DUF4350 domain-containing protein [Pyrinomonadaceae bacterium]